MADLRPMDAGEILDGALNLYRRHFGLFFTLSATCLAVPLVLSVYAQVRLGGSSGLERIAVIQESPATFSVIFFAAFLLYMVGLQAQVAATIHVISSSLLGRTPRYGEAVRLGVARIWPLFVVALAKGLVVMLVFAAGILGTALLATAARAVAGGFVAFFVGLAAGAAALWATVYVLCGYGVTSPVIVLETLDGSSRAFGRSWELTRGQRGKVLGVMFVAWLLAQMLPSLVLAGVSAVVRIGSPEWLPAVYVVTSLLSLALAPVLSTVLTFLYYDLRVRREGLDLDELGRQLGIAPA